LLLKVDQVRIQWNPVQPWSATPLRKYFTSVAIILTLFTSGCRPDVRKSLPAPVNEANAPIVDPTPPIVDPTPPVIDAEPSSDEQAQPEGRSVERYLEVREKGCTVENFRVLGICTPAEARVVGSTPLAMAGHDLDGTELEAFFRADGTWYPPSAVSALTDLDAACVAALAGYEQTLRAGFSAYDASAESRILGSYEGFGLLAGRKSLCDDAHRRELRSYPAGSDQILEYLHCWDDGSCVGEGLRCDEKTCAYHAAG
jgi:hypothetical protein